MKPSPNLLKYNSIIAFVLAAMVATTLHEIAHFVSSIFLGGTALLTPIAVQPAEALSRQSNILVAGAGPLFSLVFGLVIIWLCHNIGKGFWRLFWLWLGFTNAQLGFGYLVISPLFSVGDTGFVLSQLNASWLYYVAAVLIGAAGTYYLLPKLFAMFTSGYVANKKEYYHQVSMAPWIVGTITLLLIYLAAQLVMGYFSAGLIYVFLDMFGTATMGLFAAFAGLYYYPKVKKQKLSLSAPIIPIIVTLIVALVLIFALSHGLQIGVGTIQQ